MKKNIMIVGDGQNYSLDTHETKLNNNVLVVGTSGSGKTRSIVTPNLLQASGSYVVTDPKGNLYRQYGPYLKKKGYDVKKLDFTDPMHSVHYNFFHYIRSSLDIIKVSHMLQAPPGNMPNRMDPFWDEAAQLLIQSLIAYLYEACPEENQNLHDILRLISYAHIDENDASCKTVLDRLFEDWERAKPDSYAVSTYKKFRIAAGKTLRSILITVNARIGLYDAPEVMEMMSDDTVHLETIGRKKTALFVVVSDTDRSMDGLVNTFFTQAMNELCRVADKECKDNRLPVPVRFIMDDFATNCKIDDFPRMIASIRSREISVMLMIQAESQLKAGYGEDGQTIIGNCDTYVYLGGNDVDTAQAVARRCDVPLKRILNMPVGTNWVFRRGSEPLNGKILDLNRYLEDREL